ncbi:hypothetical protein UlMin_024412 [Ulmus minor]
MIARTSIHSPQLGLILCMIALTVGLICSSTSAKCLDNERKALLKFKQGLVDDSNVLFSWENHTDCCHWRGVQCNNHTGHVIMLDLNLLYLEGINLEGKIDASSLLELGHLNYLDLSFNDFEIFELPNSIDSLSQLKHLKLAHANLVGSIPHQLGNLSYLQTLDLSGNSNLTAINLDWLSSLSSLRSLNLSDVDLSKVVSWPQSVSKLHSLLELQLRGNQLKGALSDLFTNMVSLDKLTTLDLSNNLFWGPFPDLKIFPLLKNIVLDNNQLNGSVPESIGQLSTLKQLSLFSNSFRGVLTEAHFANLSRLNYLDLSYNHLSLNLSSNWIPPFDQLENLRLSSCDVGPAFPKWIQTQWNLTVLDIAEANISDSIPDCFSGSISSLCATRLSGLKALDLSNNNLSGELPNCWMQLNYLFFLNLANNHFSGKLPASMGNLSSINLILDLGNNNFSGSILPIWNIFPKIQILNLRKNNLSGEIPSLQSCDNLQFLDLGDNKLSGRIPECIGRQNPPTLEVLVLQSNEFYGSIPSSLCNLQALRVLDFSGNNISGFIPQCFSNFSAMSFENVTISRIGTFPLVVLSATIILRFDAYEKSCPSTNVMWKGIDREFGENLKYLRSIDLSRNKLSGEIPESITLLKLQSLNLSRNRLTGSIPENFSPMRNALESLDLSRNQLSGRIPESFSSLTSLSKLDLSYNKLTGRIPSSTQLDGFLADPYFGNEDLCGPALNKSCSGDDDKPDQVPDKTEGDANEGGFLSFGFYLSVAVGFVVGFWGACGSLIFQSSWRYSVFALMTRINDQIYVATRLMKARSQRTLRAGWYVVNS